MDNDLICTELLAIADDEQKCIERVLPDQLNGFALFMESIRLCDFLGLISKDIPQEDHPQQNLEIIRMGWNLASSYLFKPLNIEGFPMTECTEETRAYAYQVLFRLGRCTLLRRAVDMIRAGLMTVERDNNMFRFRKHGEADTQFMDQKEFDDLENIFDIITSETKNHYGPWDIVELKDFNDTMKKPGNFISRDVTDFIYYEIADVQAEMRPLIRPWTSNHGLRLLGYDSSPDLDHHFLAKALKLYGIWRDEAGFSPGIIVGEVDGNDLMLVIICIISFHLKHIHFALTATKEYPDISLPQNLTIFTIIDELIESVAEFTNVDPAQVTKIFDVIMLKPGDVDMLRKHTSRFMPLLIDVGNGFMIRPISSVLYNPLLSLISTLEYRDPNFRHRLSATREGWLRSHLYAIFSGDRYQKISSNIKLREHNRVITDIDAVVFDTLTGELALFQIKWQDFFYNDVKQLRSKASNLIRELDEWTEKTNKWLDVHTNDELMTYLKLSPVNGKSITTVRLFAISRNAARMQGYGYRSASPELAIANWPQFYRNRLQTGPTATVISDLFHAIRQESSYTISTHSIPFKINISNKVMNFEDLWSTISE